MDRLGLFLQEHIRLLNSVEVLELVCYLAWGIFYHNERFLFLYALGSFPCSSRIHGHTQSNMVWKSTSNHVGNLVCSTNWSPPFLILGLVHIFLSLSWTYVFQREEPKFSGEKWVRLLNDLETWNLQKSSDSWWKKKKNALCLTFVPFPHCLIVIASWEFGENISKNRQSLHCMLVPSLFRSYCDLGPKGLIRGLYPSKSSFRWIPLHFGELFLLAVWKHHGLCLLEI